MKPESDELIKILEAEKKALKAAVKNSVAELEYLNAHYYTNALSKINGRLRTLYKLQDPFYEEKQRLERETELYESFGTNKPFSDIALYYKEKAEEGRRKLQKLNDKKGMPIYDDQKIDDALFSIWAGIYGGFILYLNVNNNLGITFEQTETDVIEISINVKSALEVEYFFSDEEEDVPLNKFYGLGFNLNFLGNRLIYKYDISKFKDALFIKKMLSRLIYDVFTYVEIDNPASLVYF